jgi:Domain of unknown function (DUF4260)
MIFYLVLYLRRGNRISAPEQRIQSKWPRDARVPKHPLPKGNQRRMLSRPGILLHLEGAVLFLLTLYLYHLTGAGWGWFFLLFLWPDLGMLGYLANPQIGSSTYNLVHIAAFPVILGAASFATHHTFALSFALIWLSHIEFDRALGYGLKYPTFFKDTHLQRVEQSA